MTTTQTRPCECGKKMILRSVGAALLVYPVQQPQVWWCGGCGRIEEAPPFRARTIEAAEMYHWEQAQDASVRVWVAEIMRGGKPYYWTGEWVIGIRMGDAEFVITDDIHRARQFPSEESAFEIAADAGVWPAFFIREHQIG